MLLISQNPHNNNIIKEYSELNSDEILTIIENTNSAYNSWKQTSFSKRSELMLNVAQVLRKNKKRYAELMTEEMGKPIKSSYTEIEKCAWVCEYYAEKAEEFLQTREIKTDANLSFVSYKPLGIILAIMPWNFPFWQVFRFAAPALMAGNAGLLKHASNVSGCALAIEEIFLKAGFPKDLFRTLLISSSKIKQVVENKKVKAITLTGSTEAGKSVAALAGSNIKKTVLELGGNDPYIILEDADLELAAENCVFSRMLNSGQSCIAAKRFIVVDKVYEKFKDLVLKRINKEVLGDPMNEITTIGPLAQTRFRDELHEQVSKSIEMGAECLLGGHILKIIGAYYPPTLLVNVKEGMPAYHEELFGPVAVIIRATDEQEAIKIANDSDFGLGAAIFSKNISKAEEIANNDLEAGCCFVNSFVKSDPRLPFGGIKDSGYGRELSSNGIKEFVNTKTVYIKN